MKWAFLFLASASVASAAPTVELSAEQKQFFEKKIAPILSDTCYKCHSQAEGKTKGGLALDSRAALLKGGADGEVLVPGEPTKSMLMHRVLSKDPDEKMPPKDATLSPQQIADLSAWIKMGAPDPRTDSEKGPIAVQTNSAARNHWGWQPIKLPALPPV